MLQKSLLLTALSMTALLSGCAFFGAESAAVGVIGGSDGPTAVYLANPASGAISIVVPAVILALIIVAGVVAYLRSRKKK